MLKLAEELRDAGLVVELGYSGNLQRRMRRADRIGARAAVLLGDDEIGARRRRRCATSTAARRARSRSTRLAGAAQGVAG